MLNISILLLKVSFSYAFLAWLVIWFVALSEWKVLTETTLFLTTFLVPFFFLPVVLVVETDCCWFMF